MNYSKVASDVIQAVGKDNLIAAAHCATRLRLVLKDDTKVNQKALDENPDVKSTFKINGQYQVIIGAGDVNFVYDELIKKTGLSEISTSLYPSMLRFEVYHVPNFHFERFLYRVRIDSPLPLLQVVY
ncbi:hypothetical protein EfmAA610_32470 (plasmid) [Enterococcus faecium]|nr:hypothetical protein EfmAA610_32470 [Enterococcus faecium]